MMNKSLYDYTVEDLAGLMLENVDAAVIVDPAIDAYKSIIRKGMFETFLKDSGIYHDLILDLWFHFNDSNEKVSGDYQIFADNTGVFKSKYSRRLKIVLEDEKVSHLVQLTVYPFDNASKYIFIMDEFDDNESLQESLTTKKINTIQNTYLFSMYIDLVADTTSSINVTEISDDVVNYNLKYSDWRMMIVNMIWPEDQEQFLSRTDPEYLKTHFTPGRTSSYDCMMRNLEGKFIWVKLIFSRAQTYNDDDYRFVFMVQDINDKSMEMMSTLQKYEEKAIKDPLTGVLNHGEIETQLNNAIARRQSSEDPISVMMLDLDKFKEVNDNYGHSVGDTTLKQFAKIMMEAATEEKALVGRWGGEEFVIVCRDKDGDTAYKMAENLREKVAAYQFPDIYHITCSIGVTELKAGDDFKGAFDRLDKAMYASKQNGRNKVTKL
ncbi:MAG: GGDEF domain-containing protein [Clostridiales bacterium]|nr:GGDEF domain-containing protein [Clostridiales bacterium]